MKIAFIGQKGIPARYGGVEKHVEELAVQMASEGHEVFVYARPNYTDRKLKNFKGVKIIHLPSVSTKHLDAISHTFLATVHALFQSYDVIHYHAIGPSSLLWIPKFFKRKAALIATFHCQDYFHQKWGKIARWYLHFGEKMACKIPNQTIVVSRSLKKYVKEKYKREAVFIPNGARISFNPSSECLGQWNLKEKRYILYVGRLIKHKGVHYLIEAFKKLEDTNKLPNNFKLVITGEGFYTDDYVKYLYTISEKRPNIIFTGNQTGIPLEQLFSHAYLFVQPSESEGLSIALLEAMGYGLAALVSDIPENIEAIGKTGYAFQGKNIDDLVGKLAFLLNNQSEVTAMGKKARRRLEDNYSWYSITRKTLALYQKVLEKENPQPKLVCGKIVKI
jgi:glycosyltransferase involved in cell wall biosynthesis